MAVATYLNLTRSAATLEDGAREEVRAHALTLQMALEEDYLTGRSLDAQRLINRLGENSKIYCVILFDEKGDVSKVSNSLTSDEVSDPEEAKQAIATGKTFETVRQLGDEDVFSIIVPLREGDKRVGAIEVAQAISFVKSHIARTRRDITLTALLLCAAIFLVVLLVTRYSLAKPIQELVGGVMALGSGNLTHRVDADRTRGELALLANEFNHMADQLAEQRRRIQQEAEERLELERQLRHSERLATAGRLAAGVAHEIGAPLQVIDGRAKQLVEKPEAAAEKRQRNLNIIRTQVERITRIVRNLLNLARPYNLNCRTVELSGLIAGVVETLETQAAQSGVEIKVQAAEKVSISADADLLNQVLLNICLNGIQAMPSGGVLQIRYAADSARREQRQFAGIRITDTGIGIDAKNLPHLFDPFFTTKEVGSGTGLGLAVSSRIIEEHGGWIEASNNPDGGARFTIYLPQSAGVGA